LHKAAPVHREPPFSFAAQVLKCLAAISTQHIGLWTTDSRFHSRTH